MELPIKHKRGTTVPTAGDLVVGEIAINTTTGMCYTKTGAGNVVAIGLDVAANWGNIGGTLTSQTDLKDALDAKQSTSGMSNYLSKAGNLSGLTDVSAAQDNINLGINNTPIFNGVTVQSGGSSANLRPTFLSIIDENYGEFIIWPKFGIQFPDMSEQTTAFTGYDGIASLESPTFTGDPKAPTPATSDNDTSIATTAFVKNQDYLTATNALPEVITIDGSVYNPTSTITKHKTILRISGSADMNIQLPVSELPSGTQVIFIQLESGRIDLTPSNGNTILSEGGKYFTKTQYSVATAVKAASNEWFLYGDLVYDVPGFPPLGTLLSEQCVTYSETDFNGTPQEGLWAWEATRADGSGGSTTSVEDYDVNGCYRPAGFLYYSQTSNYTLSGVWGDFVYGYIIDENISDGMGGVVGSSQDTFTAADGELIYSSPELDTEGRPCTHYYRFDSDTESALETVYIDSGYPLFSSCIGPDAVIDAFGTEWSVELASVEFADGNGGSYTSSVPNWEACGPYPEGFCKTYTADMALFITYEQNGVPIGDWQYAEDYIVTLADGTYDGSTSSGGTRILYDAGYEFYSYLEGMTNITYYYLFDGVSGYTIETSGGCTEAGTLLDVSCANDTETDANGDAWTWPHATYTYADGSCGTYTEGDSNNADCGYIPAGFMLILNGYEASSFLYPGRYDEQSFTYSWTDYNRFADGNGGYYDSGSSFSATAGDLIDSYPDGEEGTMTHYIFYDGNGGYYIDTY
jgi:hypothetical protein